MVDLARALGLPSGTDLLSFVLTYRLDVLDGEGLRPVPHRAPVPVMGGSSRRTRRLDVALREDDDLR